MKSIATYWLPLCLVCCVACLSRVRFDVLPNSPQYVLRSPDSHRTPFSEVLQAYNGYRSGQAWIDLTPLMELRTENAYYVPGVPRSGVAGFLGTEVARYSVKPGGLNLLSVQSMQNRPKDDPPVQDLIPGRAMNFSQYRLYYEIVFARTENSHGSVLLGAESRIEMKALAAQLSDPDALCTQQSSHCVVFPEACTVSVEMKVILNGKPTSVIWGSTLSTIAKQPRRLQMLRLFAGELRPIRIHGEDPASLLLPLLPGDQITWN